MKHKVLIPSPIGALSPGIFFILVMLFVIFILPSFFLAIKSKVSFSVLIIGIGAILIFLQQRKLPMLSELADRLNKIVEQIIPLGIDFLTHKLYETRLSNAYKWSIQAALNTEYPHGIIYILENTLEQLKNCGLDFLPFRNSENSQYGMPNQTNLKNVITQAYRIKKIWSQSTNFDQSRYMEELRMKIKPEEMYLDVAEFDIPANMKKVDIYRFEYTEEDYRNEMSLSQQSYQTPRIETEPIISPPKPQKPKSDKNETILSFDEWLEQNSNLKEYFSEEELKQAYKKYLSKYVLSFEEFVNENPDLEYFSPEQQQKAYQKYLSGFYQKYLPS